MQTTSSSTMSRLKEATAELHTRAERSEFQQQLIRGGVSREHYARWLAQLFVVHAALETRVRELVAAQPALGAFVREELYQAPRLREDLAFFGVGLETIAPTRTTARITSQIEAAASSSPIALLGFYYVLEGSKNGSRYIAKALRRTLGITPGAGDRYLDPHGEDQMRLWASFKQGMDAVEFSEGEVAAMIGAASAMFEAAEGIGADVLGRG